MWKCCRDMRMVNLGGLAVMGTRKKHKDRHRCSGISFIFYFYLDPLRHVPIKIYGNKS